MSCSQLIDALWSYALAQCAFGALIAIIGNRHRDNSSWIVGLTFVASSGSLALILWML